MSHPILPLSSLQSDVFLLNSHPGHFTVALTSYDAGHLLLRTYEANLPSSLTRVLSITLPFSGNLPVSGYGTSGYETRLLVFLDSLA